jgi:hypothetical protein
VSINTALVNLPRFSWFTPGYVVDFVNRILWVNLQIEALWDLQNAKLRGIQTELGTWEAATGPEGAQTAMYNIKTLSYGCTEGNTFNQRNYWPGTTGYEAGK